MAASAHPTRRPLLALILLSPIIAEMLSGSSPPLKGLNPITPLLLTWLYGAGVLLMRETAVRWKTGWPSSLLLGAAYGIIEEGLAVKSFFDPGWMDLGTLAWYGRWLDVNWVWAMWLTIYHAVVSIAIPIFLTEWIWPRIRGQPLTSRRGYITAIGLLAGATVFINLLLTPYRPSVWHFLGAVAAVVFLAWAAKKYAGALWARLPSRRLPRSPRVYALAGFGFLMGSFLLYGGGPSCGVVPIVTILEGAAVLPGGRNAPHASHLGRPHAVGPAAFRLRRGVHGLPHRSGGVPRVGRLARASLPRRSHTSWFDGTTEHPPSSPPRGLQLGPSRPRSPAQVWLGAQLDDDFLSRLRDENLLVSPKMQTALDIRRNSEDRPAPTTRELAPQLERLAPNAEPARDPNHPLTVLLGDEFFTARGTSEPLFHERVAFDFGGDVVDRDKPPPSALGTPGTPTTPRIP